MINISDRYQCIFVHIPKGAGTSIKTLLDLPGRGHPPWQWYASNFPEKWSSYLTFTIVRNPWDRFVSAYTYARTKNSFWHNEQIGLHPDYALMSDKSFEECCSIAQEHRDQLKHESWYPQHMWITQQTDGRYRVMVDLVLRLENLAEDFAILCNRLGIPSIEPPLINASQRGHYRSYYNDDTASIIADVYSVDIELLGYKF